MTLEDASYGRDRAQNGSGIFGRWSLSSGGAGDARAGGGAGGETLGGDRLAAPLAPAIAGLPEPFQSVIQLGQVPVGLVEQSGQLGPLERDRRALGIMLVVGGDTR